MNRLLRSLAIVLCVVIMVVLTVRVAFREFDFGTSLPQGFPVGVPIVPGSITSCKMARSDDLVCVIEVRILTDLSFQDTVAWYGLRLPYTRLSTGTCPSSHCPIREQPRRPAMPSSGRTRSPCSSRHSPRARTSWSRCGARPSSPCRADLSHGDTHSFPGFVTSRVGRRGPMQLLHGDTLAAQAAPQSADDRRRAGQATE
jgi:hypothetical protein